MDTAANELTYYSFPIEKWEKNDDGDLVVYGKATDGSVDSDEQIVDPAWSAKSLQDWHDSGGNVRVQHQAMRDPAGRSISIDIDKDGDSGHWVKSLVVEPVAKRLVEKGVLRAYSVGIARPVIKRDPSGKARGGIVAGGSLAEISLVDRPANKACGLVLAKSEGGPMRLAGETGELWGDPEYLAKVRDDPEFLAKSETEAADPDVTKQGDEHQGDTAPEAPAGQAGGQDTSQDDAAQPDAEGAPGGTDAAAQDDTDGGADAISKADDETRLAYRAQRREWLSREPSVAKAVGGTEYLQKRADWVKWNAEGEQAGLAGTRDGAMLWLARRGVDPASVAGEKRDFSQSERDSAASSGAAMGDGSFPIKNGEDLGNAIHLAGHAKDPAAARAHIKRRAAALGLSDKIPDSWKTEVAEAAEPLDSILGKGLVSIGHARLMLGLADDWEPAAKAGDMQAGGKPCPTCKGDGKIMDDKRTCPDCNGSGKLTPGKKDAEPETVKGSKDCTGCGRSYDSDTNVTSCEGCGKKLPMASKAAEVVKGSRDCTGCGKNYDSDAGVKFCGGCGKKLPSAKAAGPDPALLNLAATVARSVEAGLISAEAGDEIIATAAKASRPLPADTKPVRPHREPDGSSTVERLEPQAGLPTDRDSDPDQVPSSVQGVGEGLTGQKPPGRKSSYALTRMHDVLCAAYSADAALAEYPALKAITDAIDMGWWRGQVFDAVKSGKGKKAARLTGLYEAALGLKEMDPAAVEDGRAELHKAFSDMYPDEHIRPGMAPKPGSYQRPYLSAGHASEHASGSASIPPSAHVPSPEQFRRPLITAGHEQGSPANKDAGDIRSDAPVRSGASRVYYSNAQREAARVAMQAIHDHISGNFPDMCPMASSKSVLPPDMGARNVPHPHSAGAQGGIASVKAVDPQEASAQLIADAIRRHAARENPAVIGRRELEKAAAAQGLTLTRRQNPGCGCCPDCTADMAKSQAPAATAADLTRTDVQPAVGLTAEQIKSLLTETFDPYADRVTALQKQLDEIAARPDPAMAPVRGAFARPGPAAPVERRSLVDEAAGAARATAEKAAADEAAQYRTYITTLTHSPDPSVRERAITVLNKLSAGG